MSAPMMMNNNNNRAQTLSLHDPEFKNMITVPMSAVHHMPPAHLEISRLVLCRKYDPSKPTDSCPMGDSCKFVHINMSTPQLQVQSIHVNYAYRSLDEVVHERLPGGEQVAVMAPNGRAPSQLVPSEMILMTRGAMNRNSGKGPVSHCAHYFYNRMCNRGERCSFLHCLFIDPSATEFQRAPPRAGASVSDTVAKPQAQPQQHAAQLSTVPVPMANHSSPPMYVQHISPVVTPTSEPSSYPQVHIVAKAPPLFLAPSSQCLSNSSCDLSESPRSHTEERSDRSNSLIAFGSSSGTSSPAPKAQEKAPKTYRHNPYSLLDVLLVA